MVAEFDKYHGGPADGQCQPATPVTDRLREDDATGAVYERSEALDDALSRGWRFRPLGMVQGSSGVVIEAKAGMTLEKVEAFVRSARAVGIASDAPVKGLLSLRGVVKRLEVKPPQ